MFSGDSQRRKSGEATMYDLKATRVAAAILIAGTMVMIASGPSNATPAIAKKTGDACTKCHSAPPALNDYGKKYKETQGK
jgi:hypothetical protein